VELPKDGDNERRNASEYFSNILTWFMKESALIFGFTEDKISYEQIKQILKKY
jgi:hypothetical protein